MSGLLHTELSISPRNALSLSKVKYSSATCLNGKAFRVGTNIDRKSCYIILHFFFVFSYNIVLFLKFNNISACFYSIQYIHHWNSLNFELNFNITSLQILNL